MGRIAHGKLSPPDPIVSFHGHLGQPLLIHQFAEGTVSRILGTFLEIEASFTLDASHQSIEDNNGAPEADFVAMIGAPVAVVENWDQDDGPLHTVVIPAKLVPDSHRGAGI